MSSMQDKLSSQMKKQNFAFIKKELKKPQEFRTNKDYVNKACFSYDYKQYGKLETWCLALPVLQNLPESNQLFHELLLDGMLVKPYLDIEWYREKYPELNPDAALYVIKSGIIQFFKERKLEDNFKPSDIYVASCHRPTGSGFKYSFRIIVSTEKTIVFKDSIDASFFATSIKSFLRSTSYQDPTAIQIDNNENSNNIVVSNHNTAKKIPADIIDMGVYKKTQNIRLVGHSKSGEFKPMKKMKEEDDDINFIISHHSYHYEMINNIEEHSDKLMKTIQKITPYAVTDPDYGFIVSEILEKVKIIHPTVTYNEIKLSQDASGFYQFNYKDRSEPCFCSLTDANPIYHDKIGFFVYVYKNLIYAGCHSGHCVDNENKKIIKLLGSLNSSRHATFEKVSFDNEFSINHDYITECLYNDALGMSNLFEKMYLEPKRIKWINDGNINTGTTYYWSGKLWEEDDYKFLDRLIPTTLVKVLRSYIKTIKENNELSITEEIEAVLESCKKQISVLCKGVNINQILKFLKPMIRDTEFSKIKDVHPYRLSCKNGMVDLKTGELTNAIPSDNVTKAIDVNYDSNANTDDFDKFVKEITSDEKGKNNELYNYIKWVIGYSIQGIPKKKLFFILYGEKGFNGKSMFLNTISDILDYYAVSMDKSVVLESPTQSGNSHSSQICQLENCRLGILSETKEDAAIDETQIKTLTGLTDKLSAREIFGKQKEFIPTFVPLISSNHKIRVNLTDKAMYERLILIPFQLSFVPNPKASWERKADDSLAEKLQNNKEGILKWIVDASLFYNSNLDMKIPDIILEAKKEYKKEMDDVEDFIKDNYTLLEKTDENYNKSSVKKIEILSEFKDHCSANGIPYKKKKAESKFDSIIEIMPNKIPKTYIGLVSKNIDKDEDDLDGYAFR